MTREEAIKALQIHMAYMPTYSMPKTREALDMAISALREQEDHIRESTKKVQTNADHIRSMSDEELARCLVYKAKCTGCNAECCDEEFCLNLTRDWLKEPYKEEL